MDAELWGGPYQYSKDRLIFNASAVQASNPINRRSVMGWRCTTDLLEPARQCLISSGLFGSAALTV